MKHARTWMKALTAAALAILLVAFAVSAGEKAAAPASKEAPSANKAATPANVAQVNGKNLSYHDFERQLRIFKQQVMRGQPGEFPPALEEKAKAQVLHQMIAEELLYQQSLKLGLKLDKGFVEHELETLKQRFGSDEQYQQILKRMQMTEPQLKEQMTRQAMLRKIVDQEVASHITITKADAQKYFETNKDKFHQPERVRAQHILIKVEPGADDQKKSAARKKLEAIKKRILAGEDFGKLAKELSEGPSNVREGDLGYFTRGRMVKSFEDVAFSLAPNEVSGIVETQFGYHLIKVLDHQPEKDPTFEEVEPRIMAQLRNEMIQQKIEPYINKLREAAKVEIFLK